ncbi:phage head-tail joining protein [Pseudomonas guariconensis]|uniref:phage head-tail joining protein n=1 Tax=Pseudomonas guariconensis TaxID=1288410 RepID=UPI002FE55902
MAYTPAQLAAVERAIARGERIVRYSDRTVEYRSVDELLKVRDQIRTELAQAAGPRSRVVRLYHGGKGL